MTDLKYSDAQAYDPTRKVKGTDVFSLLDPTGTIGDPDPTKRQMQACTAIQLKLNTTGYRTIGKCENVDLDMSDYQTVNSYGNGLVKLNVY